jgi:hypothetical protein
MTGVRVVVIKFDVPVISDELLDKSGVDGVRSAGMSSSLAIVLAGVIGIEYGGGVTSSRMGLVNKTFAGSLSLHGTQVP